ncbi:glutaredoxin family protein [candidate division WOR-3 bacterium]|nr:glutaredoxin family protein [candidate division WOR-3 bacterium]
MKPNHVDGKNKGKVVLYALSTCVWCKKTKRLLNELGVEYDYYDIDLMIKQDKDKILKKVKKFNALATFPTIIINDERCIRGYKEDEIKEVFD